MVITSIRMILARWRKREEGQAMVEFALVAPIFLLLVLGVVEFGRAWNVYQTLTDAAREGARTAVIATGTLVTADTVAARINWNLAAAALDTANATKNIIPAVAPGAPISSVANTGDPVTISISYPYHLGWIQGLMGWTNIQASFNMNTAVTFRKE